MLPCFLGSDFRGPLSVFLIEISNFSSSTGDLKFSLLKIGCHDNSEVKSLRSSPRNLDFGDARPGSVA